MPKLPQEIIEDILSRLPVKNLVQLKCGCKAWFALISDPQFAKLQLKKAKETTNLQKIFFANCPLQTIDVDVEVFGDVDSDWVSKQVGYPENWAYTGGSCNGLDSVFYGLGYDVLIDDYKVVRGVISAASSGSSSREAKVEVLELKTNTWRRIQYPHLSFNIDGPGVFSNDHLHWLGIRDGESDWIYVPVIISFDLIEERFKMFAPVQEYNIDSLGLGNLGDNLVILCEREGTFYEVWEMKKNGAEESWTRLFSVSIEIFPYSEFDVTLVGFKKDGKLLLDFDGRELVVYNTKEETLRNFLIDDDWDHFAAVIYEESLISPNVAVHDEAIRLNQAEDVEEKGEDSSEEVQLKKKVPTGMSITVL
ncbi:F-box protein CPR1-like [Pistacia vera]|uniref:F-box protein CPR1-like n=1 Tax=Pistacia vera TaxID=55513 RepID=UPI0012631F55|nr:F-box protein CPR1-like [Pistacia vera]